MSQGATFLTMVIRFRRRTKDTTLGDFPSVRADLKALSWQAYSASSTTWLCTEPPGYPRPPSDAALVGLVAAGIRRGRTPMLFNTKPENARKVSI
jgi:hypothetical protein